MVGRTISHYRIIEKLGAGGMGEVFKAEDLSLGRLVALKFLPASMAGDRQAVERLRREARTASILNHPGICTIHAIEELDGQQFIAMELLDGQPLSGLIANGALPLDTLLPLALQICDALEAAHSHGIVHRDIKPGNIFITKRQQAKILDFGLVKVTGSPGVPDSGDDMTIAAESLVTTPGMAVGTVAYMSPEQARGEALDARTDLFSFGLVLYEMATGRRAFGGSTTAVVFDAILNRMPPPVAEVNPSLPAELDRIIGKAVEKERQLRYQTALDLGTDLQRLKRDSDSSARGVAASRSVAVATGQGVPASGRVTASVSGISVLDGSGGTSSLSGTVPHAPTTASGTVVAGTSPFSKVLVLGAAVVIVVLTGAVAYLGGRIQGLTALIPISSQASAPATPTPAVTTPAATTQAATSPAATTPAPVAAVPAQPTAPAAPSATPKANAAPTPSGTPTEDDRAAAAKAASAAAATELDDIRTKLGSGQQAQAIAALQAFIERPANRLTPDAYMLLGNAYEAADRGDEAIAAYASVVEKFKTSPRAPEALFRQAQRVIRSRQSQREVIARQLFTRAADEYPRSDWAPRALLARAQVEEGIRERIMDSTVGTYVPMALPTYRTVAERYPSQSEGALWRMSEMLEDLNRYPLQARALIDLATRFPETKFDAYWKLGEVRERRLKDKPGAIDAYSKVPASSSKYRNAQKKVEDLKRP